MLRLLKNTTSRLVFAGLAIILIAMATFLPKTFAAVDDIMNGAVIGEDGYLEDGRYRMAAHAIVYRPKKYMSISGSYDMATQGECANYFSLVSFTRGSGVPADAEVTIDTNTGEFSITSDTGMDLAELDELVRVDYDISADSPAMSPESMECFVGWSYDFSIDEGGTIENYHVDGETGRGISRELQNLSYAEAEVYKGYNDDDFINPLTETTVMGAITYSSSNDAVATVNPTTGEVHIVGSGDAIITATAAQAYRFVETSASYTLNVAPKQISITDVSVPDKTYDGTTNSEVGTVTLSEAGLVQGVDYTVAGVLNDANVGVDRIATVTVTLIGDAANNYVLTSNTFDKSDITISPYSITSDNIFLEYYVIGHDGTEKEPGVTVKIGNFTVDPNEYTVGYENNVDVGTATVTVTAKDNANIASNAQKNFEIVDKNVLEITGISGPQTKVYTGLPVVLDGTLTVGPNTDGITVDDLTTTWYIYGAGGWIITTQPTDAGIYKVVYSYDGPNYAGTLEVDFDIDRAVSPDPAELGGFEIEAGKRLSDIEGIRTLGFAWDNENTIVERGRNTYLATYTYNNDPVNYTTLQLRIPVNGLYTPDPEPTPAPSGDDGTVTVPDTGRFTSSKSGTGNMTGAIGVAIIAGIITFVIATMALDRKAARNRINFDKK